MEQKKVVIGLILTILSILSGCASVNRAVQVEYDDIRLELVHWARLAQNAHNVQPWHVVLDSQDYLQMSLFLDASRPLPETDPLYRQITISLGNFLAVLDARAAHLGYKTEITLFPKGEFDLTTLEELPVANIRLLQSTPGEARARYPIAGEIDALTTATIKYRYSHADLPAETRRSIENYSTSTVEVRLIEDPGRVAWLNNVSIEAFALEMDFEPTQKESFDLMRNNRREREAKPYGLTLAASFPTSGLWFIEGFQTLFPSSPASFGRTGTRLFTRAMDDISQYILITSSGNSRTTQVETGMILQAIWMELHLVDHLALANSQALQEYPEMRELYEKIHAQFAPDGQTIQMLLAVGKSRGGRHLPGIRLPVEKVVSWLE